MSNRPKVKGRRVGAEARHPIDPTPIRWARIRNTIADSSTTRTAPRPRGRVPCIWQARVYDGTLTALVSNHERVGWHISISHSGTRYPTWDELADAKERFVPDDVEMAMILPKREEYVNLHETCLHIWEVPNG